MEQTAQVAEVAIAWATEVYRPAPAVALGAEAALLAVPRMEVAGAGRAPAVRGVPLVWAAALAVARGAAVAGGGGNQS
jgi:hypothetical protein